MLRTAASRSSPPGSLNCRWRVRSCDTNDEDCVASLLDVHLDVANGRDAAIGKERRLTQDLLSPCAGDASRSGGESPRAMAQCFTGLRYGQASLFQSLHCDDGRVFAARSSNEDQKPALP